MEPAKGFEPLTSGLRKLDLPVFLRQPTFVHVIFLKVSVDLCCRGLVQCSAVKAESVSEKVSEEVGMPRHKTGCAITRSFEKNGRTHKSWFARIEYVDETGIRKRVERKPEFNTKTSAREKARQMLAELVVCNIDLTSILSVNIV